MSDHKFGIQYGRIHEEIHVGRINKAGNAFLDGKEVLTLQAVHAVCEFILAQHDGGMILTVHDGTRFDIEVKRIDEP